MTDAAADGRDEVLERREPVQSPFPWYYRGAKLCSPCSRWSTRTSSSARAATAPCGPRAASGAAPAPAAAYAGEPFPVVSGVPALVDFEHSVLDADRLRAVEGASEVARSRFAGVLRQLVHPANTTAPTQRRADAVPRCAPRPPARRPRMLVVGGGTVGDGLDDLYADPTVDLISFDVYASPATQFVGDGHAIPLADGSIDGVIVQAVLEHVLEPTVVAAEIERVLRPGGIVYADTPFLQQVHEGPYDFTRFTDSGHRYLFRRFERIDSGAVAGAGTALRWSVDHFVRALTRSVRLGRIVALCFFWLSRTSTGSSTRALRRRGQQRLLPRPQDRAVDLRRRHHRLLPRRHECVPNTSTVILLDLLTPQHWRRRPVSQVCRPRPPTTITAIISGRSIGVLPDRLASMRCGQTLCRIVSEAAVSTSGMIRPETAPRNALRRARFRIARGRAR